MTWLSLCLALSLFLEANSTQLPTAIASNVAVVNGNNQIPSHNHNLFHHVPQSQSTTPTLKQTNIVARIFADNGLDWNELNYLHHHGFEKALSSLARYFSPSSNKKTSRLAFSPWKVVLLPYQVEMLPNATQLHIQAHSRESCFCRATFHQRQDRWYRTVAAACSRLLTQRKKNVCRCFDSEVVVRCPFDGVPFTVKKVTQRVPEPDSSSHRFCKLPLPTNPSKGKRSALAFVSAKKCTEEAFGVVSSQTSDAARRWRSLSGRQSFQCIRSRAIFTKPCSHPSAPRTTCKVGRFIN